MRSSIAMIVLFLAGCSSGYVAEPLRQNPDPFQASSQECELYAKQELGKQSYEYGYVHYMAKRGWKLTPRN
jgi:hypothetical protein